jgi:hypothetical protein
MFKAAKAECLFPLPLPTEGGGSQRTEQILPYLVEIRQIFDILAQFVLVWEEKQQDFWSDFKLILLLSGNAVPDGN